MLAPAVRTLAQSRRVLLAARRPRGLDAVPGVEFVAGDWKRPQEMAEHLRAAADRLVVDSAVLWVHTPYRATVFAAVAPLLHEEAVVVLPHGSAAADPSRSLPETPEQFQPPRRCRRLVLGFADSAGGGTRWLSDTEISDAALRALDDPGAVQTVGRTSPWSDRP